MTAEYVPTFCRRTVKRKFAAVYGDAAQNQAMHALDRFRVWRQTIVDGQIKTLWLHSTEEQEQISTPLLSALSALRTAFLLGRHDDTAWFVASENFESSLKRYCELAIAPIDVDAECARLRGVIHDAFIAAAPQRVSTATANKDNDVKHPRLASHVAKGRHLFIAIGPSGQLRALECDAELTRSLAGLLTHWGDLRQAVAPDRTREALMFDVLFQIAERKPKDVATFVDQLWPHTDGKFEATRYALEQCVDDRRQWSPIELDTAFAGAQARRYVVHSCLSSAALASDPTQ